MRELQRIGVAMIGTGFMSQVHIEALRRVGVTVTGILGSTPEKSRSAANRLGLARGYATYAEVLDDPTVHAVHLGVPNRLHLPMAREGLRAGKHILCEKPLAMDSGESAELVSEALRHPHLAAGVNYNIRYYPLCFEARERVRHGELGRLFHLCGSYTQDWLLKATDYNWRVLTEEGGALRALSDIGSHWLDLMHFITGLEIESLCADFTTVHPVRQRPKGEVETFQGKVQAERETEPVPVATDDYGCVLLRFRGGARGNMWVSQVTPGRKNCVRFEIAGSRRTLAWNSEQCEEMWVGSRDEANQTLIRDPSLLHDAARQVCGYPGGHNEGYPDTFKQCFRDFYTYIARGDFAAPPTFPTFADGHRDILLCEAIQKSFATGRWVTLEQDSTA